MALLRVTGASCRISLGAQQVPAYLTLIGGSGQRGPTLQPVEFVARQATLSCALALRCRTWLTRATYRRKIRRNLLRPRLIGTET